MSFSEEFFVNNSDQRGALLSSTERKKILSRFRRKKTSAAISVFLSSGQWPHLDYRVSVAAWRTLCLLSLRAKSVIGFICPFSPSFAPLRIAPQRATSALPLRMLSRLFLSLSFGGFSYASFSPN